MSFVNGKDVIVYLYIEDGWRMYACARSCSLSLSTSTVETSTTGSGIWAAFMPQKHSYTGNMDGIVNLDGDGRLTLADLQNLQILQTKLLMRFDLSDSAANSYVCEGYFYITNSSFTGAVNDIASFAIELQGTGELTQIYTPTPFSPIPPLPPMGSNRYDGTGTEGQTEFVISVLENRTVLEVVKDGIGLGLLITGTPVGKQVLFTVADKKLTFAIPFEDSEAFYVIYK